MKYKRWYLLLFLLLAPVSLPAAEPLVITHPADQHLNLTRQGVRAIFSMRLRSWADGSNIQVFVLSDQAALHKDFAKSILGVFPHQLRRGWDRLVYSGTGQAPIEVTSLAQMKQKIAATPGAIGYLSSELVDDTVQPLEIE